MLNRRVSHDACLRSLALLLGLGCLTSPPALHAQAEGKKLASEARTILEKYCVRCHGTTKQSGDLDVRDHKNLVAKREESDPYVVPRDAKKSYVWQRIDTGDMPPGTARQPSDAEKKIVLQWIEAGAPDFSSGPATRPFVSTRDTLLAIRDDMTNAEIEDRPYLRYFTFTNLHNDSRVSEEELRLYRAALSKAINSMTWKKAIVIPRAVDKHATVFAIDLRDLDWDRKPDGKPDRWLVMMRRYPYGLRHDESRDDVLRRVDDDVYSRAGKQLVYVRADWFVTTATRPPLYHDMLRLPTNAQVLEQKLGVNVAENFRRNRLWRAGMVRSGVSKQNRLVERHDALYGAYWKSYDFKKGGERGTLTDFPLGPDLSSAYGGKFPFANVAFKHDGGEIIFNLPNGLQGYYLIDGKDRRIDVGPIDVVSDEQKISGTPEIVTGLSCMFCHKNGMISNFKDDVRQGYDAPGAFRLKVRQLYPRHETVMKKHLKEDEKLFMTALEKAIGPFVMSGAEKDASFEKVHARLKEPVGAWAVRYQNDLELPDVAHELGIDKPEALRAMIRGNPRLRGLKLAPLLRDGGAVKRADWDSIDGKSLFQEVAGELELGNSYRPR